MTENPKQSRPTRILFEQPIITKQNKLPTIFSTLPKINFSFSVMFILSSATAFNLEQSKNFVVWEKIKGPK